MLLDVLSMRMGSFILQSNHRLTMGGKIEYDLV